MSISDEIRDWCDTSKDSIIDFDDGNKLFDLADRIDTEMIELPKSADGQIWTGREVCFWTSAEQAGYHNFGCVALRDDKWYVEDVYGTYYDAESVWYERPDSLECIADELEGLSVDSMISDTNLVSARALSLAKRIRKLAKKEDQR